MFRLVQASGRDIDFVRTFVVSRTNGSGEEGLFSIASRPTTRPAAASTCSSPRPTAAPSSARVPALRRPERRRPGTPAAARSRSRTPGRQPQRRPARVRPRRLLYVSTGDGGNTPSERAGPRLAARQDPADRPATGAAAPATRSGRRVWASRPAQPVAVLVRPRDRRPADRRRRPGHAGGDRLGARAPAAARAPTTAGRAARAATTRRLHVRAATGRAFARTSADGYRAIIGGYVVRDPGLPTLAGRYLFGDAANGSLRSIALPDSDDRAEPLAGHRACRRSARTPAGASTWLARAAPSTDPGRRAGAVRRSRRAARRATAGRHGRARTARRGSCARRSSAAALRLALRCDEACRVAIAARLRGVRRLTTATARSPRTRAPSCALKLSRKTARRTRRARPAPRVVRVGSRSGQRDAAGNRAPR